MSTSLTSSGVQFPDATAQTTAAIDGGLGTGQIWYQASGTTRMLNVGYSNTTGRPISVSVVTSNNTTNQGALLRTILNVNNGDTDVAVEYIAIYGQSGQYPTYNCSQTVSAIINNGDGYYAVTLGGTGGSLAVWAELRDSPII